MRTDYYTRPATPHRLTLVLIVLLPALAAAGCRRPADGPGGPQQRHADGAALPATASPRQVVKAFNAAMRAGDYEQALALSYAPDDTHREYLRSAVALGAATERLRKAVAERFGPAAEYELDFGLPRDEEFEDAVERVGGGGKEATVVMAAWKDVDPSGGDATGATRLVRRGGRWLVDARPRGEDGGRLHHGVTMNRVFARAADLTVPEVKAGKFSVPSDVAGAFRSRPVTDPEGFRDLMPAEAFEEADSADDC